MNEEHQKQMRAMDAFISAVTGAGYAHDKFTSYYFSANEELDDATLEALYTDNDLAATIVERIVHDALRSGYELDWQGADDVERRDVKDWVESTYDLTAEVKRSRIYSRLFGGGAVFMGVDGNLEQMAIKGSDVRFLRATPSSELAAQSWYADPAEQDFGAVAYYRLRTPKFQPIAPGSRGQDYGETIVHHSRFIPFYGVRTTDAQLWRDEGWGKSVLHRVYSVLKKFESSFDSVLHTLSEQSIPVYRVKALLDLLASENGELLAKRFELINAAKGAYRAIILDQEETYERVEASLSQSSNVVDSAMVRVAGAAGMPVTILFGREPAGQNATGKSDLENWNQQVASEQSLVLGPAIARLYNWLLAQPSSPLRGRAPADLKVEFPAVETPSLQDQVNLYAQIAGADAAYQSMGAVTAMDVAIKRAQTSSLFPNIDLAFMRELQELQRERLLNPPDPMEMMAAQEGNEEDENAEADEEEAEDSKAALADALSALLDGKDIEVNY